MKILIITNNLKPNSGWGRYSLGVINELLRRDLNISVMVEHPSGATYESVFPPTDSIWSLVSNIMKIRSHARDCDVVHAFDGWPYAVLGYFAVLGTSKSLFVNAIGTYSVAPLRDHLKGFLLRRAYAKAQRIFAISAYVKDRIVELTGLASIQVVLQGLSPLPAVTRDEVNRFKAEEDLSGKYPILLTVGEIKERKGQLDTLKAAALIKEKYPQTLYIMIASDGDSGYVEKIRAYATSNGLGGNFQIRSDVREDATLSRFYAACDVFLLNSNNDGRHLEGFGLVILEANQFGKPAVGSRGCGIEDAIRAGFSGFLSDPGNPQDIAAQIFKIIEKKMIKEDDVRDWSSRFTWKKTVDQYVAFYMLQPLRN